MSDFKIQKLIWDSTFFGFEIGKIEVNNIKDDKSFKNLIEKSSFQMIQIFSKNDISKLIGLYSTRLIFLKPNFGTRLCNGI